MTSNSHWDLDERLQRSVQSRLGERRTLSLPPAPPPSMAEADVLKAVRREDGRLGLGVKEMPGGSVLPSNCWRAAFFFWLLPKGLL